MQPCRLHVLTEEHHQQERVALHGLFVLCALAWLLSFTAVSEQMRVTAVQLPIVGYVAVTAANLARALDGRSPFPLTGLLAISFWTGVALLVGALVATIGALHRPAPQRS